MKRGNESFHSLFKKSDKARWNWKKNRWSMHVKKGCHDSPGVGFRRWGDVAKDSSLCYTYAMESEKQIQVFYSIILFSIHDKNSRGRHELGLIRFVGLFILSRVKMAGLNS